MLQKLKYSKKSKWLLIALAIVITSIPTTIFAVPNTNPTVTNNTVRGQYTRISAGNTTVRYDANRTIGVHRTTIPAGASFTRTADEARQLNGWTWFRGTLSGNANLRGNIPTNSEVWISSSQFSIVPGFGGSLPMGNGDVCRIAVGNTSVRHDPTRGVAGTAGRLPNTGARFYLTGDSSLNNGGWTWRLGAIIPLSVPGQSWNWQTQATPDNGFTDTNYADRFVWVASSQLLGAQRANGTMTPNNRCN